jgi:hypothetical protein
MKLKNPKYKGEYKGKVICALKQAMKTQSSGEERYNSTLSLTSVLEKGGWLTPRPYRFTPDNDLCFHCIGGGVGPGAGLDGCGKSHPHLYSIPGPSNP